ncbi:MAG: molecular chaperone DnaJ [Gammaproteobacteria bacterium]|nr:MAG: molecular chaperone DnaJ [Gammaproteobacteria bacterium]
MSTLTSSVLHASQTSEQTEGSPLDWLLAKLEEALSALIKVGAAPIREYDLIRTLSAPPWALFDPTALRLPLSLFQTHFLLFHSLYRLRNSWLADQAGILVIDPLGIRLLPWLPGTQALVEQDKLATYYQNIDNLFQTSESDVEAMLDHFFRCLLNPHQRAEALETLGLPETCSNLEVVRNRYRELAMRHHPDRGGCVREFQSIQSAWQYLKKVLA